MLTEKAALSYALTATDTFLYPKRALWPFLPARANMSFGNETIARVRNVVTEYIHARDEASPAESAFWMVLIRDFENILECLDEMLHHPPFEPEPIISEYFIVAEDYLQGKLKLPWIKLEFSIHDVYPPPMDWQDTYAFTALQDIAVELPAGVYFKRDHLFKELVQIATLHENVHNATLGPGSYRFFDNGIADFLAAIIYCHYSGDIQAIRFYRTYLAEVSPTLTEYPDYLRMISSLVQQVGLDGLECLIRMRATNPKQIDWLDIFEKCRLGILQQSDLPDGGSKRASFYLRDFENAARKVMAHYNYPEKVFVISPLAYQILSVIYEAGPLETDELRSRLQFNKRKTVEMVCDELADHRLVHNGQASQADRLYIRPKDHWIASETLKFLNPTAVRVSPQISDSREEWSGRTVLGRIADRFHTYGFAAVART